MESEDVILIVERNIIENMEFMIVSIFIDDDSYRGEMNEICGFWEVFFWNGFIIFWILLILFGCVVVYVIYIYFL